MPFLRFSGFLKEDLAPLIPDIVRNFAKEAEVEEEIVKVELVSSTYLTDMPSYVEILMFQRVQEKHDRIVTTLDALLVENGFEQVHIYFVILSPHLYYKKGKPLTGYLIK
ncbi:DUF1904 family protein [Ammoniphilus sp. CFH 90114]|uniref:DUF1904 family protein n=1 Tax=Ammoniphilus sp. CFH 90114 TaxID=2493665 RepID=UPI00100FEC7E|nr:DUF1904 family protein [Ammoniphilus sp. CFH 90114]RXT06514.1 DUF1904 family protein [Ammoniphilus sp. CFH 90114]